MDAVIFDLDGLLADTEIISLKVYQELLKDFGLPFTEETYSREYSGNRDEENVHRFLAVYTGAGREVSCPHGPRVSQFKNMQLLWKNKTESETGRAGIAL